MVECYNTDTSALHTILFINFQQCLAFHLPVAFKLLSEELMEAKITKRFRGSCVWSHDWWLVEQALGDEDSSFSCVIPAACNSSEQRFRSKIQPHLSDHGVWIIEGFHVTSRADVCRTDISPTDLCRTATLLALPVNRPSVVRRFNSPKNTTILSLVFYFANLASFLFMSFLLLIFFLTLIFFLFFC